LRSDGTAPHDLLEVQFTANLVLEVELFLRQPVFQLRDLVVRQRVLYAIATWFATDPETSDPSRRKPPEPAAASVNSPTVRFLLIRGT